MMKAPDNRRLLFHSSILLLACCMLLLLMVIGSGILPVPIHILMILAIPPALVLGCLSSVLYGRIGMAIRIVIVLAMIMLVAKTFAMVVDAGMNAAKAYGDELASRVLAYHDATAQWPEILDDISNINEVSIEKVWPLLYDYDPESRHYTRIGGFFISYRIDGGEPQLVISRRDSVSKYNWFSRAWE